MKKRKYPKPLYVYKHYQKISQDELDEMLKQCSPEERKLYEHLKFQQVLIDSYGKIVDEMEREEAEEIYLLDAKRNGQMEQTYGGVEMKLMGVDTIEDHLKAFGKDLTEYEYYPSMNPSYIKLHSAYGVIDDMHLQVGEVDKITKRLDEYLIDKRETEIHQSKVVALKARWNRIVWSIIVPMGISLITTYIVLKNFIV